MLQRSQNVDSSDEMTEQQQYDSQFIQKLLDMNIQQFEPNKQAAIQLIRLEIAKKFHDVETMADILDHFAAVESLD